MPIVQFSKFSKIVTLYFSKTRTFPRLAGLDLGSNCFGIALSSDDLAEAKYYEVRNSI